jgi:hypothetical protein
MMAAFRAVVLLGLFALLVEHSAVLCGLNASYAQGPSESLGTLAGEYFLGDGRGVNKSLVLSSDGRVLVTWSADDGGRSEANGRAEVTGQQLVIHGSSSQSTRVIRSADCRFTFVRWGKRVYLIPGDRMLSFCNAINLGLEPRADMHGQFFLRVTRGQGRRAPVPAEGVPGLPVAWEHVLLKEPLHGVVTGVVREGVVTINLGSKDGIRVGMELWVEEAAAPFATITVAEVSEANCTARSNYTVKGEPEPPYGAFPLPKPARGHRVYTRIPAARRPSR